MIFWVLLFRWGIMIEKRVSEFVINILKGIFIGLD